MERWTTLVPTSGWNVLHFPKWIWVPVPVPLAHRAASANTSRWSWGTPCGRGLDDGKGSVGPAMHGFSLNNFGNPKVSPGFTSYHQLWGGLVALCFAPYITVKCFPNVYIYAIINKQVGKICHTKDRTINHCCRSLWVFDHCNTYSRSSQSHIPSPFPGHAS